MEPLRSENRLRFALSDFADPLRFGLPCIMLSRRVWCGCDRLERGGRRGDTRAGVNWIVARASRGDGNDALLASPLPAVMASPSPAVITDVDAKTQKRISMYNGWT